MRINLRAGEKLYLNGAVLRADRKVSLELMNDATFLLEAHVMSPDKATTPLRQLYFIVQTMLMDPSDTAVARSLFRAQSTAMRAAYDDRDVLEELTACEGRVAQDRFFEALRGLRTMFASDDALLGTIEPAPTSASRKAA